MGWGNGWRPSGGGSVAEFVAANGLHFPDGTVMTTAASPGGVTDPGDVNVASGNAGGAGDVIFSTKTVERGRFTTGGVFTLDAVAAGATGMTVTDGTNTFFTLMNDGTAGDFGAGFLWAGTNAVWNVGLDTASTVTKFADLFFGLYNYPAAGNTRDTLYLQQNGLNPPGIGMGAACSRYTDMAANILTLQPWSDSPSTQGGLLVRTGTAQATSTPALQLLYQNGTGPLFTVWPDGTMEGRNSSNTVLYKTNTTGTFYTSARLAVGAGTDQTQTSGTVYIKTSGADASLGITTAAGNGNFTLIAKDGSAAVTAFTVNASTLALGTNNAARVTIGTAGGFTWADGSSDFIFGTTTGTKIGTVGGAAGQKIGFWNATPIVQPVLATGAGKLPDDIIAVLQTLGLVRQS